MKRKIISAAVAALALVSCTQNQETGFAIVIDQESYNQAKSEINLYQKTVESRGLKPVLVIDRWGIPDSIRAELIRLHNRKDYPIEGCVLIGDIPVAMTRDAQHMASAFKMDQDGGQFDRTEYCIPSDRFYDSFDLEWQYLDHDTLYTDYFYYTLKASGAQKLEPTIYSARICPRTNDRGNKYDKLRSYMQRANSAAQNPATLDRILLFGGEGNLSNSIAARMDSKFEFYEQCPWVRDQRLSVTYMDYAQEQYIKTRLVDDIQNPNIDYALLSHHGDATIQYLSGTRGDAHLLQAFEFDKIHPQATMVSLDACYNGSFHKDESIQESYLFGEGNGTMLVLANSVNSIQDKWVNRYMGLLGLGMRAGYMAKFGTFLEFHLFGDPTYQFEKSADCGFDINQSIVFKDDSFWKKQLSNRYPAVQNLAMTMLGLSGKDYSKDILDRFMTSEYGMVRTAALMELTRYRNDALLECIKAALNDENEMTQRFAVLYAGRVGRPELIVPILELRCTNNLSERVEFDLTQTTLRAFDSTMVCSQFEDVFARFPYYSKMDSTHNALWEIVQHNAGMMFWDVNRAVNSTVAKTSTKLNAVRSIRNYTPHFVVDGLLEYLSTPALESDTTVQKAVWEALGWFNMSYRAQDIAAKALTVSEDSRFPATVRNEALKTYNRVK